MSTQEPEGRPPPDEQQDTDVEPGEEPGMTPPATAPEPETLPEEPDVNAPEPRSGKRLNEAETGQASTRNREYGSR